MRNQCFRHVASLMFMFTLLLSSWTGNSVQQAVAADALTVSGAIALGNNGSSATVEGYIIGHATGSNAAKFQAPFANDFNVLIADAAGEQDKTKLVNVQLTAAYRSDYGLQTNPDLIGTKVRVTGTLTAYNNFPGLRSPSAITLATDDNGTPPGDNDGGGDDGGGNGDGDGGDNGGGTDPGDNVPPLENGAGKKVLFDNTHAQTAGAADWVIEGAFSDFADGLKAEQFEVDQLERLIPYTFGEQAITYDKLKDYDVFIVGEANIPFKKSEQDAILRFVEEGGGLFFISDHYNADRNKNRWDSSEVMNGYRRGAYNNLTLGMSAAEAASPAMQDIVSSDWLADHFGLRFRYNAIGDVTATDIVAPSQAFGITSGVSGVAMHAGSTLAIIDPAQAKGIVYLPQGNIPAWSFAVDQGVYNGGGRAEGPYAAISKRGLGKAAFIGDSSPVEDATPKYLREETGTSKKTYDGFKEQDDAVFLVNTVKWLTMQENYTSFDQVDGLTLDTPTSLLPMETPANSTEPQPEPWAEPAPGYLWYDPTTFKPGSYGATQSSGGTAGYSLSVPGNLVAGGTYTMTVTAQGLNPGQTVSDLRAGIYLPGGEQIARFQSANGSWSSYGYSPTFAATADNDGTAVHTLTFQLKAGATGQASMRLRQGSNNLLTESVTIGSATTSAAQIIPLHPAISSYTEALAS
ncbi:Endonuclease YhcR precursor [compost metagenome]